MPPAVHEALVARHVFVFVSKGCSGSEHVMYGWHLGGFNVEL